MLRIYLIVIICLISNFTLAQKNVVVAKGDIVIKYDKKCNEKACFINNIRISKNRRFINELELKMIEFPLSIPDDQLVFIEDYNFDGELDIRLYDCMAQNGLETIYTYFIYQKGQQVFQLEKEYSKIHYLEIDKQHKNLLSHWRDGCCRVGIDTYGFSERKLELQKRVVKTQEYGFTYMKIYQRKEANWVIMDSLKF